jgi:hypothetical protein
MVRCLGATSQFDADRVAKVLGDAAGLVGSKELFRLHDPTARSFVQGRVVPDGMIYVYVSERSATQ